MCARGTAVLRLDAIEHTAHTVHIGWSVDERHFDTTLRYHTVDLDALAGRIGREELARVLLHIALFEINKGVSLRPARVELGAWARFVTPALAELWNEVVDRVWAQWRYVHDDPDYVGPRLRASAPALSAGTPLVRAPLPERYLAFCGGGKDSLLALHLLAESGVDHEPFVYTSSAYGPAGRQFAITDRLLAHLGRRATHRQSVYDNFLDTPLAAFTHEAGVREVTSAETPSSIFAALPIVLAHGFSGIVVAHERSANVANLVWSATGEDVNHQWGKSFAAEQRFDAYIRDHLVADFTYFSLLQPIHDPLIFAMLADLDPAALATTHSCNVRKPWCRRCAKCAYVWINSKAWLSWDVVDSMFGRSDMLDEPANQEHFRRLLGLTAHTPFECVGGVDETRLAFALAHRRGLRGAAMDVFATTGALEHDWPTHARAYLSVHDEEHGLPASLARPTLAAMRRGEQAALDRLAGPVPSLARG